MRCSAASIVAILHLGNISARLYKKGRNTDFEVGQMYEDIVIHVPFVENTDITQFWELENDECATMNRGKKKHASPATRHFFSV